MYILYIDESGTIEDADAPFVVGGLALREDLLDDYRRRVQGIVARHLDQHLSGLELHATELRGGRGPWRGIPKEVREAVLNDVLALLGETAPHKRLFAVARSPGAVSHADPLERVFEELLLRFSAYLERTERNAKARSLGLVVADKAKYERILQPVVHAWRETGTRFGRLTRVSEVPLFVDSQATRLIQLADFVAHSAYRHYRDGDDSMLKPLLGGFDGTGGKLHGLVHLTVDPKHCVCHACKTRRPTRQVARH